MDFSALIDRLDDFVSSGKKVRMSTEVKVDRQEMYALVGQLRAAVPEELKHADWISEHRTEMLAEAKQEAAHILEGAREERARLLGREEIQKGAEERAPRLLEAAEAQEREIRLGAEDYAAYILESLENYIVTLAQAGDRGRRQLAGSDGDRVDRREEALVA